MTLTPNQASIHFQASSGLAAEEESHFPSIFIEAGKKASALASAILSFRITQSININKGFPVSPKPLSIKTKTCKNSQGIPFLSGFIAVDGETFGLKGSDTESNITQHLKEKLIAQQQIDEAEKFSNQPLKIKWQELNTAIKKNIYSIIAIENDYQLFQSHLINPTEFATKIDRSHLTFRFKKKENMQPNEFIEIEYRVKEQDPFKKIYIIAYENAPITSDIDIFAILPSIPKMQALEKISKGKLHQPYNTQKTKELAELSIQYLLIKNALDTMPVNINDLDNEEFLNIQKNSTLKNAGILSPYELFIILTINQIIASSFEQAVFGTGKLIRHGSELFNPHHLIDLNVPILHIWNNKIYLTHTEIHLRDFYLHSGALKTHFLPIHPEWNMVIWGPIIAEQIQLGQKKLISEEILKNYYHSLEKKNSMPENCHLNAPTSTAKLLKELEPPHSNEN